MHLWSLHAFYFKQLIAKNAINPESFPAASVFCIFAYKCSPIYAFKILIFYYTHLWNGRGAYNSLPWIENERLTNMWALTQSDPKNWCSLFPSSWLCRSRQGWSPTVEYREIALWLIFSFAAAHEPVRHQQASLQINERSRSAKENTWAASPHFQLNPANKLNIWDRHTDRLICGWEAMLC